MELEYVEGKWRVISDRKTHTIDEARYQINNNGSVRSVGFVAPFTRFKEYNDVADYIERASRRS